MARDLTHLIGQSLMLQFEGPELTSDVRAALARIRPGGVVLFSSNIQSPEQIVGLCRDLQAEARALGLPPLLIAADQEGGTVSRLPEPFVTVPSPMAQAASGDPRAAERCAFISGRQLRDVGITMNFAPVLDVNLQPANPVIRTRAFGDDADTVARFGLAALRGYEAAGVIATAKHFPGHGDTDVDSHHGLPVVAHDRARLRAIELAPFAGAIATGVPAIMTAHIIFPALDEHPATLSRRILTGLLREELGYDGLIVTDAMDMGAIVDRYGREQAAVRAKAAGADVLEMVDTLETQIAAADALRRAVASGELTESCFETTAHRLDTLRSRYRITHHLPASPDPNPDPGLRAEALDIARQSITLLPGGQALPLGRDTRLAVIDCQRARSSIAEDPADRAAAFRETVALTFPDAVFATVGQEPDAVGLARAREIGAAAEMVLLVTRDVEQSPHQAQLGRDLAKGPAPLLHATVRAPYDAGLLPEAAATLLTYGDPPVSLQALVDVLAGRVPARGTPPVRLAGAPLR